MNSSAIASSSAVVTPGRACSPISASVSATTRPARAIVSISCGDLRMITARSHLVERPPDLGEDLLDRPVGVDADDVAARRAVVLDERRGLAVVDLEPLADRLRRVVGAALLGGALRHPLEQHVAVGDLELEDDVESRPSSCSSSSSASACAIVPREAVEDEAGDRVAAVEAVADQADHQVVVDELAAS